MHSRLVNGFAAAVAAAVLAGCASTSPVKNEVKSAGAPVPIDWQGAEFGDPIPEWVKAVSNSDKEVLMRLPEMEGKIPFLATGMGQDLDILKTWVDTNDAAGEISKSIRTTVDTEAGTNLHGNKDKETSAKMAKALVTAVSKAQFSGFMKERSFWTQVRKPDDGKTEYRYYVLYSIERENLAHQIDVALGDIAVENPEEQKLLDEISERAKITAMRASGFTQAVN